MMKKTLLVFTFLVFISIFSLTAQETTSTVNDDFIATILKEKPQEYFGIKKYIKKKHPSSEEAQELYEKSFEEKYTLGQVYALNVMGRYQRNLSDFKKALQDHEKALKLSRKIGNQEAEIVSLNLIGVCYRRQDDLREALDAHQQALLIAKEIEPQTEETIESIAIAQNSIGNIYLSLKQYDLAIKELEKGLEKNTSLNNKRGLAIAYDNIGYAFEQKGRLDEAIDNYSKSLFFNKEIGSTIGKIIGNNRLCSILIKKGHYEEALKTINSIYDEAMASKDQYYIAKTLGNLGWAQFKNNDIKSAEKTLSKSFDISLQYNLDAQFIITGLYLSDLYKEKKEFEKAYLYYKEAKDLDEKKSGEQNVLYVNNILSKYDVQAKENEINTLRSKTQISNYENSRNRNVLIITLVSLALLSVALYSIYRQRLLNNDRRVLLLEQQALQAQMNPHFIFNALNSIKLYIINNEQKNAVYYLNKFSKLIRNILDVSKVKEVSLEEELKTMDLYMSIENIRFNNEITYTQKINSDLNLDTIKVPPLVLQPFLENAIWHGLSPLKEREKEVVLSAFKVSKNLIEISIADNGIGREAAMEIKKGKNASLKRKSIGIDLTKERLKTFASDFMNDFSLKYYDLIDNDGKPSGTKVALRIPLR